MHIKLRFYSKTLTCFYQRCSWSDKILYLMFNMQLCGAGFWTNEIRLWAELLSVMQQYKQNGWQNLLDTSFALCLVLLSLYKLDLMMWAFFWPRFIWAGCVDSVCVFSGGSDGSDRPVWAQHPRVHHAVRRSAQNLPGRSH